MLIEKQLFLIKTPKILLFFVILLIFQSKTYLEMSYSNQPCTRWRRERNKACCAPPSCFQSVQASPPPPSTLKVNHRYSLRVSVTVEFIRQTKQNKTQNKKCGLWKKSNPIRFVAPLFCCVYLCQQQTSNRARSEIKPLIHTHTHTYSRVNKHTQRKNKSERTSKKQNKTLTTIHH